MAATRCRARGSGQRPSLSPLRSLSPASPAQASRRRKLSLSPSVPATPRPLLPSENANVVELSIPRLRAGYVGAGQILLPSSSSANDVSRVRNAGRALGLSHSASAPTLGAVVADVASPKTPRTLRGTVRKASKVSMDVPRCRGPLPRQASHSGSRPSSASRLPRSSEPNSPKQMRPASAGASPGNRSTGKRVSFSDEVEHNEGWHRSQRLLGSLYELRRVRQGGEPSPSEASEEPISPGPAAAAEPEDPLMVSILRDLKDTVASLRKTESTLEGAHVPVGELGGSRHATTLISARALAVVQRKIQLLDGVEQRSAAFQAAMDRREAVLDGVRSGTCEAPEELLAVKSFLAKQVHRDGEPVDSDKSDFQSFASSFGLPARHQVVIKLKAMVSEAMEWYARATLRSAQEGADAIALQRLFALATGVGTDPNHSALQEARVILGDRLALACLERSEKLLAREVSIAANTEIPSAESAKQTAEKVGKEVAEALELGAPVKHASLEKARGIMRQLKMEAKNRLANKAVHFARRAQDRDADEVRRIGEDNMPVGPASDAADAIDRELREAIAGGALEQHTAMVEARAISKSLRDVDGVRKRMAGRKKRMAENT